MRKTMYPADPEKIRSLMKKRGLTSLEASKEIGYRDDYLYKNAKRGSGYNTVTVNALKRIFGLNPEDYAPDEVNEPDAETPEINTEFRFDYKLLEETIYRAMKRVMEERNERNYLD